MKALLTSVFIMLAFQANADSSGMFSSGSKRVVKCSVVKENMELYLHLSVQQMTIAERNPDSKSDIDFRSLAHENRKVAVDWATIYTAKCK